MTKNCVTQEQRTVSMSLFYISISFMVFVFSILFFFLYYYYYLGNVDLMQKVVHTSVSVNIISVLVPYKLCHSFSTAFCQHFSIPPEN